MGLGRSRRRKKRSRPARRRGSLPLLGYALFYCFLAAGITYAIAWCYKTLRSHPTFAVETFEIVGASTKTTADLQKTLAVYRGSNFFALDLAEIRDLVAKHSWVEGVNIHGHLPRRVRILVRERTPAGLIQQGKQVMVVSSDGKIIAPIHEMNKAYTNPTQADALLDQPILIGIPQGDPGFSLRLKGLHTLEVIRETSLLFWGHIETLDLSDEQNMIIQLRNVRAPLYLGDEVIPRNIRNYLAIAQYIQKEFPKLDYIELGFPNHIVIMPKEVD